MIAENCKKRKVIIWVPTEAALAQPDLLRSYKKNEQQVKSCHKFSTPSLGNLLLHLCPGLHPPGGDMPTRFITTCQKIRFQFTCYLFWRLLPSIQKMLYINVIQTSCIACCAADLWSTGQCLIKPLLVALLFQSGLFGDIFFMIFCISNYFWGNFVCYAQQLHIMKSS